MEEANPSAWHYATSSAPVVVPVTVLVAFGVVRLRTLRVSASPNVDLDWVELRGAVCGAAAATGHVGVNAVVK